MNPLFSVSAVKRYNIEVRTDSPHISNRCPSVRPTTTTKIWHYSPYPYSHNRSTCTRPYMPQTFKGLKFVKTCVAIRHHPFVMIPKKSANWRQCGYYHAQPYLTATNSSLYDFSVVVAYFLNLTWCKPTIKSHQWVPNAKQQSLLSSFKCPFV